MNSISSSSDETYLEAYIEQLTTSQWTYQIRRTMDLIRDLDTSCANDLRSWHRLAPQLHMQMEHAILQNFDIVESNEDENDKIPEDAPDEIDEIFGWNNRNNKSTKDLANKKRKRPQYGMRLVVQNDDNNKTDVEEALPMIPTTEELLEYVLQQPVTFTLPTTSTTTATSSITTDKAATTTTLRDIYHQIQQLQRDCVQKTHEKVYVAQQAYELIDAQVQRLDQDIQSMELLLQVRCVTDKHHNHIFHTSPTFSARTIHHFLFLSSSFAWHRPRVTFPNRPWVFIHNNNNHRRCHPRSSRITMEVVSAI